MGFLSSLLPGFRHLRAPLVAGFLWLIAAWVIFYGDLDKETERGPGFGALEALRDQTSGVGFAIAIGFIAYVAGALSESLTTPLGLFIDRRGRWNVTEAEQVIHVPPGISIRGFGHLSSLVQRAERDTRRTLGLAPDLPDDGDAEPRYSRWLIENGFAFFHPDRTGRRSAWTELVVGKIVADDLTLVHRRLAGAQATQELFAEIDRTRSEAELRLAIWLPLAVLIVAFAVSEWGWWGFLSILPAVPVAYLLAYQGARRLEEANDSIIDSVRTDGALPSLELIRETAKQTGPLPD